MKLRIHIRARFDAVTPVISAILAVTVVIVAVSSTVFWSGPYVDGLQSKESLENAEMQFNLIVENIKDIVIRGADDKNILPVVVDQGSISIDKSDYDRTIVVYSTNPDPGYEITVDELGLDSSDNVFYVYLGNNLGTNNIRANIQWPDNDEYSEEMEFVGTDGRVEATHDISGNVHITLSDTGSDFGNIWLFDSNSLIFDLHSSAGIHRLSLEKGGIIYFNDGEAQVKRLFSVDLKDDSFGIHVLQILALKSFSAGGGNGFNGKISVESRGTWVQERGNIYYLKLQLHGDNAQTWLDYINNKYENKFVVSDDDNDGLDDTLFLSESTDGVQLTFLNSIIDFDII